MRDINFLEQIPHTYPSCGAYSISRAELSLHFSELCQRLYAINLYVRSIVLELPPAPAALVLVGRALATLSALSAAAFLLIAVFGPPGGDRFRPLLTPAEAGGEAGEEGED